MFGMAGEGFSLELGTSDPDRRSCSYGLPRSHNMPSRRFLETAKNPNVLKSVANVCFITITWDGENTVAQDPHCNQTLGPL